MLRNARPASARTVLSPWASACRISGTEHCGRTFVALRPFVVGQRERDGDERGDDARVHFWHRSRRGRAPAIQQWALCAVWSGASYVDVSQSDCIR